MAMNRFRYGLAFALALAATSAFAQSGPGASTIANPLPTSNVQNGALVGQTNPLPVAESQILYAYSTINSSAAQLIASATFGVIGNAEAIINEQVVSVNMTSDQAITLVIHQCIDAACTFQLPTFTKLVAASAGLNEAWAINGNYVYVTAQNTGASTTTTFNLNVYYGPSQMPYTPAGDAAMGVLDWAGVLLGAPSNFGTTPGAVSVPGMNAFTFDTVTAPLWVATGASATGGYTYSHIAAGIANTSVKTSAGTLHSITFNSAATATDVTTICDGNGACSTVIGIPTATAVVGMATVVYDIAFTAGLYITTATANGADMTIAYK